MFYGILFIVSCDDVGPSLLLQNVITTYAICVQAFWIVYAGAL